MITEGRKAAAFSVAVASSNVWAKYLDTTDWPIQAKSVGTISQELLKMVEEESRLDAFRFLYDPHFIGIGAWSHLQKLTLVKRHCFEIDFGWTDSGDLFTSRKRILIMFPKMDAVLISIGETPWGEVRSLIGSFIYALSIFNVPLANIFCTVEMSRQKCYS